MFNVFAFAQFFYSIHFGVKYETSKNLVSQTIHTFPLFRFFCQILYQVYSAHLSAF